MHSIAFVLKDHLDQVLATGRSPPIMITDDHKSSKMQQQAATRKRNRAEMDTSATESDVPISSKRRADVEIDSGVSSPIASTPATPSSQNDDNIPENSNQNNDNLNKIAPQNNSNEEQINHSLEIHQHHPLEVITENNSHRFFAAANSHPFIHNDNNNSNLDLSNNELYDFLNSNDLNLLHASQPSISETNQHKQQQQKQTSQAQQQHISNNSINNVNSGLSHHHQSLLQQQILSQFNQNSILLNHRNKRNTVLNAIQQQQQQQQHQQQQQQQHQHQQHQQQHQEPHNIYAKLQERNVMDEVKAPHLPRLHRLIPADGPIYGGSEVTVLGSNFYEGLTCLFGENPAVPTHCWSPNTLLCILPPAASAGPVVVSFKEHPLMLEGQDVVLFTYFDESDRALMELALQVVGLKTMGKVEDARQIAMRIVQGDNKDCVFKSNINLKNEYRYKMTPLAASAVYENARQLYLSQLEDHVTNTILAVYRLKSQNSMKRCLSLTNDNQHSLLHLATICGYSRLVQTLVELRCDVNQTDKNGFTALHFASWAGKLEIVKILIESSNLEIKNRAGKTAEKLAIESGHTNIVQLFKKIQHSRTDSTEHHVRIPKSCISWTINDLILQA